MEPGILEMTGMGAIWVMMILGSLAPLAAVALLFVAYRRWSRHAEAVERSLDHLAQQLVRLREDLVSRA